MVWLRLSHSWMNGRLGPRFCVYSLMSLGISCKCNNTVFSFCDWFISRSVLSYTSIQEVALCQSPSLMGRLTFHSLGWISMLCGCAFSAYLRDFGTISCSLHSAFKTLNVCLSNVRFKHFVLFLKSINPKLECKKELLDFILERMNIYINQISHSMGKLQKTA